MSLKNKNAIITGGGKGLGKAVALALAKEGVHVGITGRNENQLKETVEELKALGGKAFYTVFNVDNENEVATGMNTLISELGSVDILINNAGIAGFGSVMDMPAEQWVQIIQTNLIGAYYVVKAVIPYMENQQSGDIINVASTAGLKGNANTSAYSASKAGVIALSESLMQEMRKKNVRVITLTPSTIATDMTIKNLKITDGNPEKVLQPEDFAQMVVDILKMKSRALIANASIFSTNP